MVLEFRLRWDVDDDWLMADVRVMAPGAGTLTEVCGSSAEPAEHSLVTKFLGAEGATFHDERLDRLEMAQIIDQ